MKKTTCLLLISMFLLINASCEIKSGNDAPRTDGRIRVIASLFPLFDFAKAVGGNKAEVTLLMPPGIESHSFEPKPADILLLNNSDIFIYTNKFMEPWVGDILKGVDNKALMVVDASRGIDLIREKGTDHHDHHHGDNEGIDPHIWLDFSNSVKMVETIAQAYMNRDPSNTAYYRSNADAYKAELSELDRNFKASLSECADRTFVSGGHYTFGYLARRYGLQYFSAYGFSPDAEPTSRELIGLTKMLKQKHISYIFYEELISPRIAETISRETGARLLKLHAAHNISREDLRNNVSFISLMNMNLRSLMTGLRCR